MTIAFAKDRRVMLIDVVKRPRMILNSGAFGRDFGLLTSFIFFSKKKIYSIAFGTKSKVNVRLEIVG